MGTAPCDLTRRIRVSLLPCLAPAALALVFVGCGDGESPPLEETCPDNLVTVSVQHPDSSAPTFTWAPPCAVSLLQVSTVSDSQVVWSVSSRLQNIIGSGVVYGQAPFGSVEDVAAQALLAGTTYEVRIQRAGQTPGGTGLVGGGTVSFTR
jgi:hypothetical protein